MTDSQTMNGWGALIFSVLYIALLAMAGVSLHAPMILALATLTAGLGLLSYVTVLIGHWTTAAVFSVVSWVVGAGAGAALVYRVLV